jgi:hypothetical protein
MLFKSCTFSRCSGVVCIIDAIEVPIVRLATQKSQRQVAEPVFHLDVNLALQVTLLLTALACLLIINSMLHYR